MILWVILFLLLSAIFSASEIAFISANKLAIEIQKKKGSRKSRILTGFYDNHRSFLGAMLVGNNIALVIFTSLMTQLIYPYLAPYTGRRNLISSSFHIGDHSNHITTWGIYSQDNREDLCQ